MRKMRWAARIGAVFAVLLAIYTVWPLFDLYRLAAAVKARDTAAFARLIDVPSVRRSLSEQVIGSYMKLKGLDARLGPTASRLAIGAGVSAIDAFLAELLKNEALLEVLSRGESAAVPGLSLPGRMTLTPEALGSVWAVWADSDYRGRSVYFSLPPDKSPAEQFHLRLWLIQWRWKLAGIDLPQDARVRIAQEIVKRER